MIWQKVLTTMGKNKAEKVGGGDGGSILNERNCPNHRCYDPQDSSLLMDCSLVFFKLQ